jgi:hypothetical protein
MLHYKTVAIALGLGSLALASSAQARTQGDEEEPTYEEPAYQQPNYNTTPPYQTSPGYQQPGNQLPPCPQPQYQQPAYPQYQPPPPYETRRRAKKRPSYSPYQTSISVGGGVSDFISSRVRRATEVGGMWDARLTVGTRSWIAFEVAYVGTVAGLERSSRGGNSNQPYLISHGFDSDLRINFLPWRVQPYIFGGVGYNYMNVGNRNDDRVASSAFGFKDNQLVVPTGAGLSAYLGKYGLVDVRFTYRALFFNDIFLAAPDARLDQWTVSGRLGVAF